MKALGAWSAASSFSLGGMVGCIAGGAMLFPPFSLGAAAALIVALAVGVTLGAVIHVANSFAGVTNTALATAGAGKVITGAAIAGYIALSAIAVTDVATSKAPSAYNDGYESGIAEIHRMENSENSQQSNNIQVATPTKKPTKAPTSRPNPTKTKTPQPSYPTLYADQNYQCREGPGKAYSHVADIFQGTSYKVIWRASNGWYAIAIDFANTSHKHCWIGGGNVSGDLSQVPYYEVQQPSESNGLVPIYEMYQQKGAAPLGYLSCTDIASRQWFQLAGIWMSSTKLFGSKNAYFEPYDSKHICGWEGGTPPGH